MMNRGGQRSVRLWTGAGRGQSDDGQGWTEELLLVHSRLITHRNTLRTWNDTAECFAGSGSNVVRG